MHKHALDVLSNRLVILLTDTLPKYSVNWWQERVVDKLSYQQQGFIQSTHISTLEQLDLAALLRIIDQNWHEIAGTHANNYAR